MISTVENHLHLSSFSALQLCARQISLLFITNTSKYASPRTFTRNVFMIQSTSPHPSLRTFIMDPDQLTTPPHLQSLRSPRHSLKIPHCFSKKDSINASQAPKIISDTFSRVSARVERLASPAAGFTATVCALIFEQRHQKL